MPAGADTSICAWSAGSAKHAGRHPLATAEAGVDAGRRATIQTIDNDVGRTSDLWPPQQHPVVAGYAGRGIEKHAMCAAAHCLQHRRAVRLGRADPLECALDPHARRVAGEHDVGASERIGTERCRIDAKQEQRGQQPQQVCEAGVSQVQAPHGQRTMTAQHEKAGESRFAAQTEAATAALYRPARCCRQVPFGKLGVTALRHGGTAATAVRHAMSRRRNGRADARVATAQSPSGCGRTPRLHFDQT